MQTLLTRVVLSQEEPRIAAVNFDTYQIFSARQHAIARYMLSLVRPSVCPSVTQVDQSKTVEVRITQSSPQSSPMTSFLMLNFTLKLQWEDREWGC